MTGWEKFEQAIEMFDTETLLDNLARALSDDELSENEDEDEE